MGYSCLMPLSTTFVISWWSVLLTEETGVHWESHRSCVSLGQTLSHKVRSNTRRNPYTCSVNIVSSCCFTAIEQLSVISLWEKVTIWQDYNDDLSSVLYALKY